MSTPLDILKQKRTAAEKRITDRENQSRRQVHIGMATCEIAAGSKDVMEVFSEAVGNGLDGVVIRQKGCSGRCNLEPTVEVIEEGRLPVKYVKVTRDRAAGIIERHIRNGEVVEEWTIG